jgi:DivIVA domain-containing protein
MSTTGIGLLGSDAGEELHPQFTRVLKGFDADEVEEFLEQMARRTQSLEKALEDMREQRDAAQRRYASVKDEAYRQAASRMADVLRTADLQAERLRTESEDEATHRVAEATKQGEQIRFEAQTEAQRLRQEGASILRLAQAESERVLGGLAARREAMIAEMGVIRDRMNGVLEQLENVIGLSVEQRERAMLSETIDASAIAEAAATESTREVATEPTSHREIDTANDDLLGLEEGFDLIIPDFLGSENDEP